MLKSREAFTMLELVFVIVIIGILAAVAIPRLMFTRDDAIVVKGRSEVAAIRNGISLQKSRNMLRASSSPYPAILDKATANSAHKRLFFLNDGNTSNILDYPIYSKKNADGHWWKESNTTYDFFITQDKNVSFTYNPTTGSFDCNHSIEDCKKLTE